MNQERIENMFKDLYPELKVTIKSFEVLPRFKYVNDDWVTDKNAYFIGVNIMGEDFKTHNINEVFTNFTGYEFNFFVC